MTGRLSYPKRLIEVDLPIKRISAHARREKNLRNGHISTLHIWWARRPLAACRSVICAALWPDPADSLCPSAFVEVARTKMLEWTSHERQKLLSADSRTRFEAARQHPARFGRPEEVRAALLDFIADFANWDNSTVREYLDTSRALTQAAHEALGGAPGTRPLVVDPFCGGGSIPLEALRVGADAFASDLNPVPVLLNKIVLEYIPRYGQRLADEVRKWGEWIKCEAEKELAEFYPKDPDGATPIAYLWARTIQCEGPGCGAEVPLIRSLWLGKKANRSVALQLVPRPKAKRVELQIVVKQRDRWVDQDDQKAKIASPNFDGTIKRGSATCPCCGYTTPVERIREQLRSRNGGAADARLLCVVTTRTDQAGRFYRLPTTRDLEAVMYATKEFQQRQSHRCGELTVVPDEPLPAKGTLGFRVQNYGIVKWCDLFTPRQALTLAVLADLVRRVEGEARKTTSAEESSVVQALLGISLNRLIGRVNSLCWWRSQADQEKVEVSFSGQTIPMKWDFAEGCPLTAGTAGWEDSYAAPAKIVEAVAKTGEAVGSVSQADAAHHNLPDDAANAFVTDPPYYDAVPYAALSDFFYVWLKRTLPDSLRGAFSDYLAPKESECIVDPSTGKDRSYFERTMLRAMAEGRRILAPTGIGVVVFAHKSTAGWETQLQAMVEAGWTVTGSWPIDTEQEQRIRARDSAALASSVHLVCRPREHADGSVRTDEVGDWRDVLAELPRRIHEWMPRLAEEGVVGADAIFACLGPALEVFSRYSRVEKASGEAVTLKDYLEQVWAAVAKEALALVFAEADTTEFEADARLTAMWLWTLQRGAPQDGGDDTSDEDESEAELRGGRASNAVGVSLEYDAARKIAQGLGVHLEALDHLVEIKGETATLLSVGTRARHLFGKDTSEVARPERSQKSPQMRLDFAQEMEELRIADGGADAEYTARGDATVLDKVHQAMILFGAGRSEALKRFLTDDAGRDARFWRLAQALTALYPTGGDEKRWVEGVLARKKSLGL